MNEFKTFKKWHGILLLIILVSAVFVYFQSKRWPETTLNYKDLRLKVLVADTFTKQYQGLSNRESLGVYDGMLFPFGYSGYHTMVMRDMRFSLDFIWLQGSEIVDISRGAKPEPDRKESDLTRYKPKVPVDAVLEVPVGSVAKWGVQIGDSLTEER